MAFNNYGNQYADKIYAEHPIALWPLDEDVYYLSLIDDNNRLFTNWTLSNCTATNTAYPSLPDTPSPFDSDIYSTLTANTTNAVTMSAISSNAFNPAMISADINTFCVNFWLYHNPTYINWFKVGYQYVDTSSVTQTVLSNEILPAASSSWMNFNNVYEIPQNWSGYIKLIIQVNFSSTIGEGDSARSVIMNGLSVGQESQTTCFVSLGNTANFIPEEIGFANIYGIAADQYGLQSNVGYYLIRNNRLLAQNDGFPIIYGTNHSTKIYPSGSTLPSFVFPGKGMLNESGRNKQYTLEMWIKLDPYTNVAKKIIGPVSSNDGIWVKEGFITLVVGDEIASHCVEEWYRPMLMHLLFKENNITMLINGEQVIDIPFNRKTIDLPENRDWWGIYSYESFNMFKIDSISIYSYLIPNIIAKKRFIYGQGTPSIQNIDNGFLGTPVTVDFSTAEYNGNVIYPDIARWDSGYFNNLTATKNYISVPSYSLPTINLGGRNVSEWYEDNYIINAAEYPNAEHPNFITFRPNTGSRTNLCPNPSFEVDTSTWTSMGGTPTRVTTTSNFGTASIQIAYAGSGTAGIQTNNANRIAVTPGKTYQYSAYIKKSVASGSTVMNIMWYNSSGSVIQDGLHLIFNPTTTWARYSQSVVAPANAATAMLRIYQTSGEGGGSTATNIFIDNILFEDNSLLLPYFDGSYSDPLNRAISTSWSGTQGLSTSIITYWDSDGINYTEPSYLNFPSLNVLNDSVAAVYGIFEVEKNIEETRTLINFSNTIDGSTFDINLEGNQIKYLINGIELPNSTQTINIGSECLVGLNFEIAGLSFGYEVSQFFSSPASIQVYIGGNGSNTFEGKIYLVGFCNQSNYQKIQRLYPNNEAFLDNGLTNIFNYQLLIDHIASYTLIPEYEYNKLYLDISVSSEWEEYFPLTQFASYVKNSQGGPVYELDMIQLNLGYHTIESTAVWKYLQLKEDFSLQTYQDLKDSQYETYFGLKKKNISTNAINIADSSLQSYITFQSLESGANTPLYDFEYTKDLSENYVIDPDLENTEAFPNRAYETKFVFKDNVIVYPPKSKNFQNYAMVAHFEINQRSILKNPLRIRSFEITSKNLNYLSDTNDESQRNYIGTKFGTKIYPEVDLFGQIDYKAKNPYFIYKTSTPYIYTTKKSGIKVINKTSIVNPTTFSQYHVSIPVNKNGSYDYKIGAINFFLLADFQEILDEIPFLQIDHKNGTTVLVLNKDETGTRIIAYNKNNTSFIDGGQSNTASFTDVLDGEYSESEETIFFNVLIKSSSQSLIENSYTKTFLQNETTISDINDTISFSDPHGYITGTKIIYTSYNPINGLLNDGQYYIRKISDLSISLYDTEQDAINNTNKINLSGIFIGTGALTEYPYKEIQNYEFYQNGKYVKNPSIKNYEWNHIGVSFPEALDFGEYYDGEITLYGGFVFNNLSYYLTEGLGIKSDISVRVWNEILNQSNIINAVSDGTYVTYTTSQEHNLQQGEYIKILGINPSSLNVGDENNLATVHSIINSFSFRVANISTDAYISGGTAQYIWREWSDMPWSEAYVLGQSNSYVLTPAEIYATYTGTNREVVDDGYGMNISQVESISITDASWSIYSDKPA